MKKTFRVISALLAVTVSFSLASCAKSSDDSSSGSSSAASSETTKAADDPILTGPKPELKVLALHQAYNFEEQPSWKLLEEITGYKTKFSALPAENADQKLLLEISSGADYDILLRMSQSGYAQLSSQNALIELNPLLDKYGANIKAAVSDLAWESVSDGSGKINAIPHENMLPTIEDNYGMLTGGIGVRSDVLKELGLEIPTNLDDFTKLLEAAKAKYGIAPLTANKASVFSSTILAAFGMGAPSWYDVDGVYTPRIKNPKMVDYLAYMQKLYKEKLIDNDFPINTGDNAKEKFASKNAVAVDPLMFWDIPSMVKALATNNPDCKMEFVTDLASDASSKPVHYIMKQANFITCISQNSKNPEHAINWLNILSSKENFQRVYVGEEGKSFELKDGNYYPIFSDTPGSFTDYTNSDKFSGLADPAVAYQMWQARARKTPEMAEAYEAMNANVDKYETKINIEGYGASAPIVQQYSTSLGTAFSDSFLKAVVDGTDPKKAMDAMIADWDKNGGLEMEKSMQEFYDKNKEFAK